MLDSVLTRHFKFNDHKYDSRKQTMYITKRRNSHNNSFDLQSSRDQSYGYFNQQLNYQIIMMFQCLNILIKRDFQVLLRNLSNLKKEVILIISIHNQNKIVKYLNLKVISQENHHLEIGQEL
ncbi:unnamed protein product [Paramecium octaurelia]|uniref:Uncharacterized protein n=1 Tax=Paramecium octaurelia TaxID=43137 RepID=A0A8S1RWR1_PAROT|nr:unnamed protein product [Paramecium octaurelia]